MLATGQQLGRFAVIGGLGFIVDGGILTVLHSLYAVELVPARLVSFSAAVTTTWFLNRHQTFADTKSPGLVREWGRYAAVNSVGALINLGLFMWLIQRFAALSDLPLIPLAIASLTVLAFNFLATKYVVFKQS